MSAGNTIQQRGNSLGGSWSAWQIDNFLTQLVSEPTREGAPLDLLFTNREGLVSDVMAGGRLGQSDHEMIEFLIGGEAARGVSRTATLDFRRADFGLFRGLVDRVPWRQS